MAQTSATKRLREYETIFLVKPDLTDDNVDKLKDKVRGIVDREGGKMIRFTIWGKKRTMYPVAKQSRAIYVHSHFLGGPNLVAEIERNLRNLDEVTRFQSVKIADEVDPESRPTLEDIRQAGDIEETKPMGLSEGRDAASFRPAAPEELAAPEEEEAAEAE